MAASYVRSLLCAVAFFAAPYSQAGGSAVATPAAESPLADVIQLAQRRLAAAVVALNQRMAACNKKKGVLAPHALQRLQLTPEQLRLVLAYFSLKADNQCIREAARDYMVAAYVREHAEPNRQPILAEEETGHLSGLVLDNNLRELEYEARYLALPKDLRRRLEAIKALRVPFDPIETAKRLGVL